MTRQVNTHRLMTRLLDIQQWELRRAFCEPDELQEAERELEKAQRRLAELLCYGAGQQSELPAIVFAPSRAHDHAALLGAYAEALEQVKEMRAAIRNLMDIDARHREFLASSEGFESADAGFSRFRREFDAAYGRLQSLVAPEDKQ